MMKLMQMKGDGMDRYRLVGAARAQERAIPPNPNPNPNPNSNPNPNPGWGSSSPGEGDP